MSATRNTMHLRCRAGRTLAAALAGAVLLAPAAAWAAAEGGHGNPWWDFIFKVINFAILVGLLYLLLRKPVSRALRNAAEGARQTLADARESAALMAQRLETQRRNMAELQNELERMREDARAEAEREAERLKADAAATAERLKTQVGQQVEQARSQAVAAIRAELADEAVKAAEAIIRERMDAGTQKRLVDDHIDRLEKGS